jgi:hypothetical protein
MLSSPKFFLTKRDDLRSFSASVSQFSPQRISKSDYLQPPGIRPISQNSFMAYGSVSYSWLIDMSMLTLREVVELISLSFIS